MQLILDTNIFIAAEFNRHSSSARVVQAARKGEHWLIWNQKTKRETKKLLNQIPPLDWEDIADLFKPDQEFTGPTNEKAFSLIKDPDDRKFAALAKATGAPIISNDRHILDVRSQLPITVHTPGEFMRT